MGNNLNCIRILDLLNFNVLTDKYENCNKYGHFKGWVYDSYAPYIFQPYICAVYKGGDTFFLINLTVETHSIFEGEYVFCTSNVHCWTAIQCKNFS